MKKTGAILLVLALLACLFPRTVQAAEAEDFNTELTTYLEAIGNERGREVTKEDLEYVLGLYSESFSDFDSVDGLKDFMGEVIKADYSNLNTIYEKYGLTMDTLTKVLSDNGETLDDYIFLNELEDTLYFYDGEEEITQEAGFDEKLTNYLNEISAVRGFTATPEMIEAMLNRYEVTSKDFETVEDLKDFLGDVIQADLSNLDYFYEEYSLTPDDINAFLNSSGKTIADYVFIEDLEFDLLYSNTGSITYAYLMSTLEEEFPGITGSLGLTEEEFNAANAYFNSLSDYYNSEETQNKLMDLLSRFGMLMENLQSTDKDVTIDQMMEMQSIYQELQDILKIKISYSLIQDGKKIPLTLADLMGKEDLENATLNITIYTDSSEFLMDIHISSDMFGTIIEDIGSLPGTNTDNGTTGSGTPAETIKTVKGGKLPKTASNHMTLILLGGLSMLTGAVVLIKRKNDKNEAKAA